jgi:hypothetical protein
MVSDQVAAVDPGSFCSMSFTCTHINALAPYGTSEQDLMECAVPDTPSDDDAARVPVLSWMYQRVGAMFARVVLCGASETATWDPGGGGHGAGWRSLEAYDPHTAAASQTHLGSGRVAAGILHCMARTQQGRCQGLCHRPSSQQADLHEFGRR